MNLLVLIFFKIQYSLPPFHLMYYCDFATKSCSGEQSITGGYGLCIPLAVTNPIKSKYPLILEQIHPEKHNRYLIHWIFR